jgi:nucleoside-diphosphate-sugar epimerase
LQLAIRGTRGILESALTAGPQLENVILAASLLSIWEPNRPGYVFTEADWNEWAPAQVKLLGKETPGNVTYMAGKVAAERAFWRFQQEEKPAFSMAAVNPA